MRRALTSAGLIVLLAIGASAQASRRLATVDALRQFPGFYHLQAVLLRGELMDAGARTMLRTDEHEIRALLDRSVRATTGPVEVRGALLDVGRLEPGDGRLSQYERSSDTPWPKPGEELLLSVTSVSALPPGTPALSLRALVLEPSRFEGQSVTVTGQFRGRNLFGDLPGAPRKSQYDFVLKNGDAALWIVGLRPRGRGFQLDVDARVDTGKWLEVVGVVKRVAGLVTIEASRLTPTSEAKTTEREEAAPPPPPPPPVEVVFSSPTAGEIEVPPATSVRIQFSRNIKPETLKEHLKATYVDVDLAAPATPLDFKTSYDGAARAVELTFAKPLERLRTVRIELIEGVVGFDGAPLVPWSLTFTIS